MLNAKKMPRIESRYPNDMVVLKVVNPEFTRYDVYKKTGSFDNVADCQSHIATVEKEIFHKKIETLRLEERHYQYHENAKIKFIGVTD